MVFDHPAVKVTAIAGGVGGAKLAHGLAQVLPPGNLTVVVNTGDDFELFGLRISPDLDTVCYTLAEISNSTTGWGRAEETWHAFENIHQLGGPSWFRLGDRDLGTHLERTRRLGEGELLSKITQDFCRSWGIGHQILPMSDYPVPTIVHSDEGDLEFQEYFVHRQCRPQVTGFFFQGVELAAPAPGVLEAIHEADIIVICPSNPWVSIDPVLAIPGVRKAVEACIVVAVSPIIGGKAVKGPAAKMYRELGFQPSALSVAQHYESLLTGYVLDDTDKDDAVTVKELGIKCLVTDTLMKTLADKERLALEILSFYHSYLV